LTVWRLTSVILASIALLVPARASAIDLNQWVQGLKAQVYVTERLEYQTNVFQVTSDTQDDLISRTVPGFFVSYERGPVTLGFGYRAEFLKFFDLKEQDDEHHIAGFDLKLAFSKLRLSLHHDLTLTSDPPNSELTGRTDSATVNLAPEIEYNLTPRLSVGALYSYTDVRFESKAAAINHTTFLYGGYAAWKFSPKADVRLGYTYGYSEFDNVQGAVDRDATHQIIYVGLRGDITPKLSSTFRVGYEIRNQESSRLQDESTISMGGDWIYRPTDRMRFALLTTKTFENSIFGQFGESVTFEASTATLSYDQQLATKIRVNARITGSLNEYPRKETTIRDTVPKFREDTIFNWGGGIDYDIQKWLSVGAEYLHTRRDSTFNEFDYKDDKVTAKLTLQF
jgi:opacity protein-like surface antigen